MAKPLRILIVDDAEPDAQLVVRYLEKKGFDVAYERVDTAKAMSAALKDKAWDIILCDFKMPELSVAKALKVVEKSGLDTPIIIVSGTIGEEGAADLMRGGAHDLILKDNLARLVPVINRELEEAEQRQNYKRTKAQLEEQDERIRLILENAVDPIITINESGIIETFNPAAVNTFGHSKEEVLGKNVKMLMPQPYHDEHDGYLANHLRTGKNMIIGIGREVKGLRKDGTIFPMELGVSKLILENEILFVGFIRDVTERKQNEEQLRQTQKMDAIGQLTGGIAHDFNNILGVILGNLQLLKRRLKDEDGFSNLMDAAINATQRGADLTGRLLAFSRRQELDPQVLNMNALVAGMDEMLRRTLGEQIDIELGLADGLGHTKADPAQLELAILNLALNARDAMASLGGGRLMIETENVELDESYVAMYPFARTGHYVCLSIADTGPGIPKEIRDRVFEPFFTTKEVGKGSGLGLSMIYGFVKQSDGHINVYSEEGRGARFRIYLPRTDEPLALEAGEAGDDLPRGSETVLLVDDDEQFRRTAILLLEDLGYTVLSEPDGRSALKSLEAHPEVDILFTDMVMPGGLNGNEVAERAQELRPGLPVLLTSGYPRDSFDEGRRFSLLSKPYTDTNLAQTLRAVLDQRHKPEK